MKIINFREDTRRDVTARKVTRLYKSVYKNSRPVAWYKSF